MRGTAAERQSITLQTYTVGLRLGTKLLLRDTEVFLVMKISLQYKY